MIQNGDIILVHNYSDAPKFNGLPWGIQVATRCYYHHCAIVWGGSIIEAVAKGVVKTYTIEEYLEGVGKWREIAVYRNVPLEMGLLPEMLGKRYAYEELAIQLVTQITNTYPTRLSNFTENMLKFIGVQSGYTCSMFIARLCGFKDWKHFDPQDLSRELSLFLVHETAPKRREWIDRKLNNK